MPGNIGYLFVKCMQQVMKSHLYHLLGLSIYYIMDRPFYEMSARVTNLETDPFKLFGDLL